MHGPPPSWSGGVPQTWPALPEIDVLDTIALELKPRRAEKWRDLRDRALGLYSWTGLHFNVIEAGAEGYPVMEPTDLSDAELERVMVQPYLRLLNLSSLYGGTKVAVAAWMPNTDPASFAAFYVGTAFWQNLTRKFKRLVVCHEIGHALGLGHRSDSKDSVMYYGPKGEAGTSAVPDDHDWSSLEGYYLAMS